LRGQRIMSCVRVSHVFGHEEALRLGFGQQNLIHVSSNEPTNILGWQGCVNRVKPSENGNKHFPSFHVFCSLGSRLLIFYFVCGTTQRSRSFEKRKK
jgi:hypothetical protein